MTVYMYILHQILHFFVLIFNESHMVSFTFDILDPRLLVAHAFFFDLLRYFGIEWSFVVI